MLFNGEKRWAILPKQHTPQLIHPMIPRIFLPWKRQYKNDLYLEGVSTKLFFTLKGSALNCSLPWSVLVSVLEYSSMPVGPRRNGSIIWCQYKNDLQGPSLLSPLARYRRAMTIEGWFQSWKFLLHRRQCPTYSVYMSCSICLLNSVCYMTIAINFISNCCKN